MVKIRVIAAMISVFVGGTLAKSLGKNDQVLLFDEAISPNIMGMIVALIVLMLFEVIIFTVKRRHRD